MTFTLFQNADTVQRLSEREELCPGAVVLPGFARPD
jgi:hypothetical protein